MKTEEIMLQLSQMGSETTKKIFARHGAREPFFGVKVQDLKTIQKKVKINYHLALELYDTGNSDAMYLAGLIADEKKMTTDDLQKWVEGAYWYMLGEYVVAPLTAETPFGTVLGLQWIADDREMIAAAGWATLANVVMTKDNKELNINQLEKIIATTGEQLQTSQNRVRYAMNNFLIAVGSAVPALTTHAQETAKQIGTVKVDMGGTSCKVPYAVDYIEKMVVSGRIGKKKKHARC